MSTKHQESGTSSYEWSKCGGNISIEDFKGTITVAIFARISTMTTFFKTRGHPTSNGIGLEKI
jgi:hypothetical protein